MVEDHLLLLLEAYYWAMCNLQESLNEISGVAPDLHLNLARNRIELIKKNLGEALKRLGVELKRPSDEELRGLAGSFIMDFIEDVKGLKSEGSLSECLGKSLKILPLVIGLLRVELRELPEGRDDLAIILDSVIRDMELVLERNRKILEELKAGDPSIWVS